MLLQGKSLALVFGSWRQLRQTAKQHTQLMRRVGRRLQQLALCRAFESLVDHRRRMNSLRSIVRRVINKTLAAAWNSWARNVQA
eukprot:SAG22_NODE_22128_length_251_cov_0.684211_1_plen_83_part_11